MILGGAVKEGLPPVIQRLIAWRKRNNLSQRAAAVVMQAAGYQVRLSAIQHWETGIRTPSPLAGKALETFLDQHPTIQNPPRFGRWIDRRKE